jgi:hypothetical protein
LTIPHLEHFLIIEVKSGKNISKNARIDRQLGDLNKIENYLRTDRTQDLFGRKGEVRRYAQQSPERNHKERLNQIIANSLECGISYDQIEEGLYYCAMTKFEQDAPETMVSLCKTPVAAYLNLKLFANTGYYPFTLSIENPLALYKFYKGELNLLVFIDLDVIARKSSARGFKAEFFTDVDTAIKLTHPKYVESENDGMKIGRHVFGRIFAEFLSLDWFIKEMMDRMDMICSVLFTNDEA